MAVNTAELRRRAEVLDRAVDRVIAQDRERRALRYANAPADTRDHASSLYDTEVGNLMEEAHRMTKFVKEASSE